MGGNWFGRRRSFRRVVGVGIGEMDAILCQGKGIWGRQGWGLIRDGGLHHEQE